MRKCKSQYYGSRYRPDSQGTRIGEVDNSTVLTTLATDRLTINKLVNKIQSS